MSENKLVAEKVVLGIRKACEALGKIDGLKSTEAAMVGLALTTMSLQSLKQNKRQAMEHVQDYFNSISPEEWDDQKIM